MPPGKKFQADERKNKLQTKSKGEKDFRKQTLYDVWAAIFLSLFFDWNKFCSQFCVVLVSTVHGESLNISFTFYRNLKGLLNTPQLITQGKADYVLY